ncbi:hypothetical protein [Streptomyces sp. NPDC003635]
MTVEQLPARVREFANYLNGLTARLDQGGGWCGVFWQRDPDGMRACLDGREVPPWDVVEALLQDLAGEYGPEAASAETEGARALHTAALLAYDSRPGGRDALGDRLDVMLREQRYAAERQVELGRSLAAAVGRAEADALRLDLAWARDDHARATARCAEIRARMAELDRRSADDRATRLRQERLASGPPPTPEPHPTAPGQAGTPHLPPHAGTTEAPGMAFRAGGAPERGSVFEGGGTPGQGVVSRAGGVPEQGSVFDGGGTPGRDAAYRAGGAPERGSVFENGGTPGQAAASRAGGVPEQGSVFRAGSAPAQDAGYRAGGGPAGGAAFPARRNSPQATAGPAGWNPARDSAPGTGESPAPWTGEAPAGSLPEPRTQESVAQAPVAQHAPEPPAPPAEPQPSTHPADPQPPAPKQRKRRRGGARFAGMVEEEVEAVVVPPIAVPVLPEAPAQGRRSPRGARFAGAEAVEAQEPRVEIADGGDRREVVGAVERLVRLRHEGRSGEAHALLVEITYSSAARYPLLAVELQRAGLGADWATLLWEAASLPADRLVAAADALVAAGRGADGEQILRQGVVRSAEEIGRAVLALAGEGRRREVSALLDAYVRVRTPEEAARSVAVDPVTLVPLLLEAARGVSDERHWDLVHALRVAGFAA